MSYLFLFSVSDAIESLRTVQRKKFKKKSGRDFLVGKTISEVFWGCKGFLAFFCYLCAWEKHIHTLQVFIGRTEGSTLSSSVLENLDMALSSVSMSDEMCAWIATSPLHPSYPLHFNDFALFLLVCCCFGTVAGIAAQWIISVGIGSGSRRDKGERRGVLQILRTQVRKLFSCIQRQEQVCL